MNRECPKFDAWWAYVGRYLSRDSDRFETAVRMAFKAGMQAASPDQAPEELIRQDKSAED